MGSSFSLQERSLKRMDKGYVGRFWRGAERVSAVNSSFIFLYRLRVTFDTFQQFSPYFFVHNYFKDCIYPFLTTLGIGFANRLYFLT